MRGLRTTLALAAALALLTGYILFVDRDRPVGGEPAGPAAFEAEAADIRGLTVTAADGSVTRLARDAGGAWRLVAPVEALADEAAASSIASSLAPLEVQRVVAEDGAALEEYGLAPPRLTVEAELADGSTRRLLVGATTPAGDNLYAALAGEPRVFLIASTLQGTFNRTPFDLRDKRALVFDAAAAESLEVTVAGETRRFLKRDGAWAIAAPIAARGDYAAVDALVGALSGARMQRVAAEEADALAAWGLDAPSVTATVASGGATATLLLGAVEDASVYARDAARPAVFALPASLVEELSGPLSDLRSKDVFDLRAATAARVEVERGGATTVLARQEGDGEARGWLDADGTAVETGPAETFLGALANLRVGAYRDDRHPALDAPQLRVRATLADGRTEDVVFAREGDDVFASRADEPGSVRLELTTRYETALAALDALP